MSKKTLPSDIPALLKKMLNEKGIKKITFKDKYEHEDEINLSLSGEGLDHMSVKKIILGKAGDCLEYKKIRDAKGNVVGYECVRWA
jgi:hypothetical protein